MGHRPRQDRRILGVGVPLWWCPDVGILLIVLQLGSELLLDLVGQTLQVSGPCVAAIVALHHDDRETLHDEHASVVIALRTVDGERLVAIRHGRGSAILVQSLRRSKASLCNWLNCLGFHRFYTGVSHGARHTRGLSHRTD